MHSNPVSVLTEIQTEIVLLELTIQGNKDAKTIQRSLVGLSLHQLLCDAFKIKFEVEDRQQWLICRQRTKVTFRLFTDELKKYGFQNPSQYASFVSRFQAKLNIENGTRDFLPLEKLFLLKEAQVKIATYMDCGLTPWEALNKL